MLERIALHQTRLRTPGLGVDSKGVALGAKGLLLFPSIDRLVAFLSIYTKERSLEDLVPSLEVRLVRSPLGAREITLSVAAESSDRMDRLADAARLVGGFTFTGTMRHFVQYRDRTAPFGYDAPELLATDAPLALYHERFSQTYAEEKSLDLRALLLRLMPHVDPSTSQAPGPRLLVAEAGLGPALIQYFIRSNVAADVSLAEWPPESALEEGAIERYLFRVPDLPSRMRALFSSLPGVRAFLPVTPGVAIEVGFRHPIELRACPVFQADALVLFRGSGEPLTLDRAPSFGDVRAFGKISFSEKQPKSGSPGEKSPAVARIALRLVPSIRPLEKVRATLIRESDFDLFRRLAYALPPSFLATTNVAWTDAGIFVRTPDGIEDLPLGTFLSEVHQDLFLPAGYDISPAVAPEVLARALDAPKGNVVFFDTSARAFSFAASDFVPLETVLLEAPPLAGTAVREFDALLDLPRSKLVCEPTELFVLGDLQAPEPGAKR